MNCSVEPSNILSKMLVSQLTLRSPMRLLMIDDAQESALDVCAQLERAVIS